MNTAIKTVALCFKMNGHEFFLALLPAESLIKRSQVDYFDKKKNPHGYQRELQTSRARAYYKYLKGSNGFQHQTILLNLRDKESFKFKESRYGDSGELTLKDKLFVVDGQHRTEGLKMLIESFPEKKTLLVPVLIMTGFGRSEEAREFLIVNKTQKGVKTDLADTLLATIVPQLADSEDGFPYTSEGQIEAERKYEIADLLCSKKTSIWYNKIAFPNEKGDKNKIVKLRSFFTYLSFITKDNFISKFYADASSLAKLLDTYWAEIKKLCPKACGKDADDYVLMKTFGLYVMHKLFPWVIISCGNSPTPEKIHKVLKKIDGLSDADWHKEGPVGRLGSGHKAYETLYRRYKAAIK